MNIMLIASMFIIMFIIIVIGIFPRRCRYSARPLWLFFWPASGCVEEGLRVAPSRAARRRPSWGAVGVDSLARASPVGAGAG